MESGSTDSAGSSLNWIVSLFTSKWFLIYCLCNYAWVLYAYFRTINKFTHKTKAEVARDEKYSAFKRNDIAKI